LNRLREKARRIVDADRKLLRDFLLRESNLSAVWTDWGTTSFVQLSRKRGSYADPFLERLRTKFDTSAVPGRFFEMPDHFRIGMGVNTKMFAEGLDRISRALTSS
jgi:aspartate/methionine/tyrosine aminotransferase